MHADEPLDSLPLPSQPPKKEWQPPQLHEQSIKSLTETTGKPTDSTAEFGLNLGPFS